MESSLFLETLEALEESSSKRSKGDVFPVFLSVEEKKKVLLEPLETICLQTRLSLFFPTVSSNEIVIEGAAILEFRLSPLSSKTQTNSSLLLSSAMSTAGSDALAEMERRAETQEKIEAAMACSAPVSLSDSVAQELLLRARHSEKAVIVGSQETEAMSQALARGKSLLPKTSRILAENASALGLATIAQRLPATNEAENLR